MRPRRVGLLGFDGVTALDLVGPLEAFATAMTPDPEDPQHCYEPLVVGLSARPFTADSGLTLKPHCSIANAPRLDTLIIPGGVGLRHPPVTARVTAWVAARAPQIRRLATVCTGIYGLAPTGLLDGRRVTTHWRFARDVARRFPALTVDAAPIFLKDGPYYTSAGITAGIDLALALIEEDWGPDVSLRVARELVVFLKRPGDQDQFSEPLRFQLGSTDRFSDLGAWIATHLHRDLSVGVLAARVHLSVRQFRRRCTAVFGTSPGALVAELRLAEASPRLTMRRASVKGVAAAVGFKSDDVFRRAFERRFGIPPGTYHRRFGATAPRSGLTRGATP